MYGSRGESRPGGEIKHDAFILRVVQTNCTKPMFLITDLLIVFLACLVRNKIQINKRLRARLDHRTPLQPTTTSRDLEQTWRQFAQKKETGTTPEILTAPSPIPILSLFPENDDNDIGNSTTASTRYIPPLLRNVNLEGPSSLETPVSTCAYQRRNSKSREWPNVSRGKKPLSWASSPATEEARGSREGLIADGRGQDAEIERRDTWAGDDIENKSLSRGSLENVKKRLWSTMFEAVEARINRTSMEEVQGENENILYPRWHLSRRSALNEGSSSVVGSSPHPFPPIPRKRSVTTEETSRRTGVVKAHLAMGK